MSLFRGAYMKPNLIGIGGQRCGTTWIYRCLQEHPQVCDIDGKEIDFFSFFFTRGYEWYERHFAECSEKAVGCDFSVSYLYSFDAPHRLHEYSPEAKVIVCVRNPIERAFDQHLWNISLGNASEKNAMFEEGLRSNPSYIEQGMYFKYLSRWVRYFPLNEQLKIFVLEDSREDPARFIADVYEFAGIDLQYRPSLLNTEVNTAIMMRSRKLRNFVRLASSRVKKMGGRVLVESLKRTGANRMVERMNRDSKTRISEMEAKTRALLLMTFSDDIAKLEEMMDRSLDFWR